MFARCEPAITSSPPCASSTGVRQIPIVRPEQYIEWPPRSQSLCHGRHASPSTELDPLHQPLRGDLGEVLAERVAGAVAVAEELADREEARRRRTASRSAGDCRAKSRMRHGYRSPAAVAAHHDVAVVGRAASATARARSASTASISASVNTSCSSRNPASARKCAASPGRSPRRNGWSRSRGAPSGARSVDVAGPVHAAAVEHGAQHRVPRAERLVRLGVAVDPRADHETERGALLDDEVGERVARRAPTRRSACVARRRPRCRPRRGAASTRRRRPRSRAAGSSRRVGVRGGPRAVAGERVAPLAGPERRRVDRRGRADVPGAGVDARPRTSATVIGAPSASGAVRPRMAEQREEPVGRRRAASRGPATARGRAPRTARCPWP